MPGWQKCSLQAWVMNIYMKEYLYISLNYTYLERYILPGQNWKANMHIYKNDCSCTDNKYQFGNAIKMHVLPAPLVRWQASWPQVSGPRVWEEKCRLSSPPLYTQTFFLPAKKQLRKALLRGNIEKFISNASLVKKFTLVLNIILLGLTHRAV